jgi:hypothetical protein
MICQLISNNAFDFVHKALLLIKMNPSYTNLTSMFEFISQNFDPIIRNNQQQFILLETKLTFNYRNNILTSLKIDIIELTKILDPYKLSSFEFECFVPLFKDMPSTRYPFLFNFFNNTFNNPNSNNFQFLKILKDLKKIAISDNFDVNFFVSELDNYLRYSQKYSMKYRPLKKLEILTLFRDLLKIRKQKIGNSWTSLKRTVTYTQTFPSKKL